jgi:integrase
MSSVKKRALRTAARDAQGNKVRDTEGRIVYEPTGTVVWTARYRDAEGKEHTRNFNRKTDGQRWLDEVTASVLTGRYVDPQRGKMTFRDYVETEWLPAQQQHRPSTRAQIRSHLAKNIYPVIGGRQLDSLVPSDIQAVVARASANLAPATVQVAYRYLSTICKAAVAAKRIAETPCRGINLPEAVKRRVVPITTEQVNAIVDAVPERYRALVIAAAGTGMRQGEIFGLTTDRVNLLEHRIVVDRQLTSVSNERPKFGPPKTKAGDRRLPLPVVVSDALLEHLALFASGPDGLIFTNEYGAPLRRSGFNTMWRRALKNAGVEPTVFHSLRHYYASLLIRHGESVKVVQERLGHASATETLDTYAHLWHDSDERTREAVDAVLKFTPRENLASVSRASASAPQ